MACLMSLALPLSQAWWRGPCLVETKSFSMKSMEWLMGSAIFDSISAAFDLDQCLSWSKLASKVTCSELVIFEAIFSFLLSRY